MYRYFMEHMNKHIRETERTKDDIFTRLYSYTVNESPNTKYTPKYKEYEAYKELTLLYMIHTIYN